MIPALIFSFLLWAGTIVLAYFWAERRFQEGYHEGYQDACQWIEDHTGDIPTPSYILEES